MPAVSGLRSDMGSLFDLQGQVNNGLGGYSAWLTVYIGINFTILPALLYKMQRIEILSQKRYLTESLESFANHY